MSKLIILASGVVVGALSIGLASLHLWLLLFILGAIYGANVLGYAVYSVRAIERRRADVLLEHLQQQQRWLAEGDPRAIYGPSYGTTTK